MELLLIAKSNMKKKKSAIILLFILVTISTMLLYTGLNVVTNVGTFLDEKHDSKNGAQIVLLCSEGHDKEVEKILKSYKGYDYLEKEKAAIINGSSIKNITKKSKELDISTLFMDANKDRKITKVNPIEGNVKIKKDSIILPTYLKVSSGYEVGDKVEVKVNDKSYKFKVAGFTEDVMFSTPSNITMIKCYIDKSKLDDLRNEKSDILKQKVYSVKMKDNYDSEKYENFIRPKFSKKISNPTFYISVLINYSTMKMGSSMFMNIIMSIVSIFALLIIIISLIVIRFNIVSNIQSDIKNIGVLQSVGYTSKQLKFATIIEYIFIAILGAIFGLVLSQVTSQYISNIVSSSVGLIWKAEPDRMCALISVCIEIISVFLMTTLTANKYKKITPLDALRNGINTHNFNKNHLPLSKSKFGLNSSLGIKSILHNKKQNISLTLIASILSFVCLFSIATYYNFSFDTSFIEKMVGLEKCNIEIDPSNRGVDFDIKKFKKNINKIKEKEEVEDVLYYTKSEGTLKNKDKKLSLHFDIIQDMKKLRIDSLVEGRYPKHDNEIMVSNVVLQKLNAELGDVIYLENKNVKKDFVIVGVGQQINTLGIGAKITEKGMQRFDKNYKCDSVYVYLQKNIKTKDFVEELNNEFKDEGLSILNFEDVYNNVLVSFSSALALLSVVFVAITVVIIVLILLMLIKMKIIKEKKMIGIYKAIGYTTKQIIWQVTMSCAPIISLGTLIGVIAGKYLINPLFVKTMSSVGLVKVSMKLDMTLILGIFISISLFAFLVSSICSYKVRKIEPYNMITE